MEISDELLAAYVDGSLDASGRQRVEAALSQDAGISRRIAQLRAQLERHRSRVEDAVSEPAARIVASAGQIRAPAQVIDLARVRAQRQARRPPPRHRSISRRVAVAVSLLVGLFAGLLIQRMSAGTPLTSLEDGQLFAQGQLARVLDHSLTGTVAAPGKPHIGLTFRDKSGRYCRTFGLQSGSALAGLACRQGQRWRVLALLGLEKPLAPATPPNAAALARMPAMLRQAVQSRISGVPLDVKAEQSARTNGWR